MEPELVFIDNMVQIETLKGRWLSFNPEVEINDVFKCSICSEYVQLVWKTKRCPYKFCPHCGVQMGVEISMPKGCGMVIEKISDSVEIVLL